MPGQAFASRGYHFVYRADQPNPCPGCKRMEWIIGRFSAECGCCGTTLPLPTTAMLGSGLIRTKHRRAIATP